MATIAISNAYICIKGNVLVQIPGDVPEDQAERLGKACRSCEAESPAGGA